MSITLPGSRRLVAASAVAGLVLAGAGLCLTAPSASAAPFAGTYVKGTSFSASGTGCAVTNGGSTTPPAPFAAGTPVSLDAAGSSTGTGPTGPDTATLAASLTGSVVAHEAAGTLTDFDATGTANASVARALGASSACEWTAFAVAQMGGTFTVNSGVLDLRSVQVGPGFVAAQLILVKTSGGPSQTLTLSVGQPNRNRQLISLSAGDYQMQLIVQAAAEGTNSPNQPGPLTNAKFHIRGVYSPFGAAEGPSKGSAAKYVTLGNSLTCASSSVTADFTNKAGKKVKHGHKPVIKKATFSVNDVKVKTVKKPNKKTLVTLGGLPTDDEVTVSAVLKLPGKGTMTVERTYYPCS